MDGTFSHRKLFVYGTLRRGGRYHRLLSGVKCLGTDRTQPSYLLYDAGHYPCLVPATKGVEVEGEVYAVPISLLSRLDRLEEVPTMYKREVVALLSNAAHVETYVYQGSTCGLRDCGTVWRGGVLWEIANDAPVPQLCPSTEAAEALVAHIAPSTSHGLP